MEPPSEQVRRGAHGIIRRGDDVLLVRQRSNSWPDTYWSLPGGTTEPGELLCETLEREVEEETGLRVRDTGQLAWLIDVVRPVPHPQLLVAYFDVRDWVGELRVDDPAGVVTHAEFIPVGDALGLLERDASPHVVAPAIEYLAGRSAAGATWCYRGMPGASPELVARM